MKKKSVKEKPLYTTRQNVIFTISNMWKWDKILVFLSIIHAPLKVLLTLSELYIVKLVISLIENGTDAVIFIGKISVFSVGVLLLNIISNIISSQIKWRRGIIRANYTNMINFKNMDADYENIENPKGMDIMQKALQTVLSINNSATENMITTMIDGVAELISLASLFAIITILNPLLLIILESKKFL